jgi:general secretion pathway protein G
MTMDTLIRIAKTNAKKRRRGARGVTLVEVLIVVAILSLIAGGVAIFAIPKFKQAQVDTAKTDCKTLLNVIDTWRMNGHSGTDCPTVEALKADKSLRADQNTNDPWGHAYEIVCSPDGDGVTSWGPDGKKGSEDDIWAGTKPK